MNRAVMDLPCTERDRPRLSSRPYSKAGGAGTETWKRRRPGSSRSKAVDACAERPESARLRRLTDDRLISAVADDGDAPHMTDEGRAEEGQRATISKQCLERWLATEGVGEVRGDVIDDAQGRRGPVLEDTSERG